MKISSGREALKEIKCFRGTEATREPLWHDLRGGWKKLQNLGKSAPKVDVAVSGKTSAIDLTRWLASVGVTQAKLHRFRCEITHACMRMEERRLIVRLLIMPLFYAVS